MPNGFFTVFIDIITIDTDPGPFCGHPKDFPLFVRGLSVPSTDLICSVASFVYSKSKTTDLQNQSN